MSKKCPFPDCYAPEMSCSNGEAKLEECAHWKSTTETTQSSDEHQVKNETNDEFLFPWTGNAMGAVDLNFLAGTGSTRLLMMAGAADAGKTSLLAAFYLLIARGISPEGVSFAGSLTLEGWENIASSLRWSMKDGPSFPAHTSSGAGRRPGLLHLSLRTPTKMCELLAADAPGEWFSAWASNQQAQQAEGARWLAACSDVLLVIADSYALSGPARGPARKALIDLFRRIGSELNGRPVALVWTKCDVAVPEEITNTIRDAAARSLQNYLEFHVSMHPTPQAESQNHGQGIVELLQWILAVSTSGYYFSPIDAPERAMLSTFGAFT